MVEALIDAVLVLALVFLLVSGVAASRMPSRLRWLLAIALVLRVVGAMARYYSMIDYYGTGDALSYYAEGLGYARLFWNEPFSRVLQAIEMDLGPEGRWWGTPFVNIVSGVILAILGPTILGEFIVFSLLAFIGLCGFALAFKRTHPGVQPDLYYRWVWLFPSLWFWPSSAGKDALVLSGLGIAVAGYVGHNGRRNLPLLFVGIALVTCVRAQVTALMIFTFVFAYWMSIVQRLTPARLLQAAVLAVLGAAATGMALGQGGTVDLDDLEDYLETSKGRKAGGGSAIAVVEVGPAGAATGMVNVLFRPLLWEVGNPMMALSALEMTALWILAWKRRRRIAAALGNWRTDPMVQLAIAFIPFYSATLGLAVANLGIIARQRVFLFPFLFALFEAAPAVRHVATRARMAPSRPPRRVPLRPALPAPLD